MRVNALLVRYEGGFREASSTGLEGTDGSPLTTPGGELLLSTSQGEGRIEGFVNYPEDSAVEADRKAASTISTLETARWQTTVGIEPTGSGDIPLTHWDVGDTITVPDQDGSPQVVPVIGLLLTEDEAGHPVYRPQVGDRIPSLDERRATTNRNFSSGDLGGRDPQAMPRSGGVGSGVAAKVPTGGERSFVVPWSLSGDVRTIEWPPYSTPSSATLSSCRGLLGSAGSSSTSVEIKVNGTTEATLTLGVGDQDETVTVGEAVTATDIITIETTSAGTAASDLTVLMTFSPGS